MEFNAERVAATEVSMNEVNEVVRDGILVDICMIITWLISD